MHILRTFLVELPEHLRFNKDDHEDTKEEARSYATSRVIDFLDNYGEGYNLFDYYCTSPMAGRWSSDFNDVILGCEDGFIERLEDNYQNYLFDIKLSLERYKYYVEKEGNPSADFILNSSPEELSNLSYVDNLSIFELHSLIELIKHTINYNTTFIDIDDHKGGLNKDIMESIIDERNKYAIVHVDCHI